MKRCRTMAALVFTTTLASLALVSPVNAQTACVAGTGDIGDGVSLSVFFDQLTSGSFGVVNGGKIHSPSGAPDLFFRAASTPTFPGALDDWVEWNIGAFELSPGDWCCGEWEGAVDGSDNWMKVIRDSDGAVSWAQFVFDFSGPLASDPTLIDIPLYVTRNDGADFTLAEAVAVTCSDTDTDGDGVPDDEDAFPNDPDETEDSDGDGVGDNGDAFPNDPTETADSDGDGVGDNGDECINSDLSATVVIDECDSGVVNALFHTGCTISDLIALCAAEAENHGDFVSCVAEVTNILKKAKLITGKEEGAIQKCAAQSGIGK